MMISISGNRESVVRTSSRVAMPSRAFKTYHIFPALYIVMMIKKNQIMGPMNESRSEKKGLNRHICFSYMDLSPRENSTHANRRPLVLPPPRHKTPQHAQHDRSPLDQRTVIHVTPLDRCLRGPKREKQDNSQVDQREGIHDGAE